MSFEHGWAAINLEMPPRVPRFEADAHVHWKLVNAVTGLDVAPESPEEERCAAVEAFVRAWNYDLMFGSLIHSPELAQCHTSMGHAVYAAGGVDFRNDLNCPFKEPEEVLAFDPWETYGARGKAEITRRFNEHYAMREQQFPTAVNTSGIYVTLSSGLIDIFGWEMLLLAGGVDPEGFGEVANRYASWMQ